MAPQDTKAPFLRIPWIRRIITKPGTIYRIPGSRSPKSTTEDSLFAEILKTPRTIRSAISFYTRPTSEDSEIEQVTTVMTLGDGMNGHPEIIHGGILATMIDESMGILQSVNLERAHMRRVKLGQAEGELPPPGGAAFTAELTVRYLRPVRTPGAVAVVARRERKEGRKEWLVAEVRQQVGHGEDDDGEVVVCATGTSLFIEPRGVKL
ncbi:hypothetical protein CLAFUW4_07191 [Fulvia fulva]|uniref:Thioesterase domain-containing protein n=1 Tax=Passalora fulva TaxID=5499 RepID=A0A9Q8PBL3_PASFU|nr:uncharacterized protein CLAFUR5_07325 [Fulvia fulva]KAK4622297.1 hypothetical protein CLAFUR4_07199 [Fulvia fulva]KAK4623059.1 hypothetical protein CLAFUR0_07196 [Fulvia fulva]UJO19489.1 hypothetical protein CLAFUR5_07325 [Fulvia fulva]WPV16308.1 hypothetical protein CLAFUW4_07191 [Fulvia fulva]WPV31524.1 hypothetical protein CLAFUW7_07192 [Fulvia fulva]